MSQAELSYHNAMQVRARKLNAMVDSGDYIAPKAGGLDKSNSRFDARVDAEKMSNLNIRQEVVKPFQEVQKLTLDAKIRVNNPVIQNVKLTSEALQLNEKIKASYPNAQVYLAMQEFTRSYNDPELSYPDYVKAMQKLGKAMQEAGAKSASLANAGGVQLVKNSNQKVALEKQFQNSIAESNQYSNSSPSQNEVIISSPAMDETAIPPDTSMYKGGVAPLLALAIGVYSLFA